MEIATSAKRWNSFVCPACRFVFRVARDHDGRGVVCPGCRGMLRLPAEGDPPAPLVIERGEAHAHAREEEPEPASSGTLRLLAMVSLPALLLLGLFAWWIMPRASDKSTPVVQKERVETPAEPGAKEAVLPAENLALQVDSLTQHFLEAPTVEELLRWVRIPEQVKPEIAAWYAGKTYKAPGFGGMADSYRYIVQNDRELVVVPVRTGDFELRDLMLVREAEGWRVDWESWAPWSDLPWEEFRKERPTEPKIFRVIVSPVNYYNFGFKDDLQWRSYRLDSLDGEQGIFGYAERGSATDVRINSLLEGGSKKPMLLRLKFPPQAPSDNQVEIAELVSENWVDLAGTQPPPP
ncbi:hypothetical protein [Luteolibacter sp. Populi]|uniref:hypothetical protein n=1 Tax=Luteolibacter sp. Populi TaxID=3230487 RepID=UPI00346532D9